MQPDHAFSPDPAQRALARQLYAAIAPLPLLCPHGHVDPRLFADPDYAFGTPTELFILADHYVFRMLHAQGIALEALGLARLDGRPVERDHRRIWQLFAEHFYLFRGTPTGTWLTAELHTVFGVTEKLTGPSAQRIYDAVAEQLATPAFRPRRLFERFNIEVLCTTDAASDPLDHHRAIRASGWPGVVRPTFRPDGVINLDAPNWRANVDALSAASGLTIHNLATLIAALEDRRTYFKALGATATDHAALTPYTERLSTAEAERLLQNALRGDTTPEDAPRFTGHMLMEMARMSVDDGLVMQLHPGALRNHDTALFAELGPDKGADIPVATEYTRNLRPLLNTYGRAPGFRLVLFTLDEAAYARELAPLAGHYPAVRLGPPWWFFDSLNGMRRYFDLVMETTGLYNTAGFNDDTRAFCSIPARHDLWRRAGADWLAGLVLRGQIDEDDAHAMARDLAYDRAKDTYRL